MSDSVLQLLLKGTGETIMMTFLSCFFGFILGLPIGIYLFLSRQGQLLENKITHRLVAFVESVKILLWAIQTSP